MIATKHILVATLLTAALIPSFSAAAMSADNVSGEQIIDVPLTGGERQRVLYAAPAEPRATIVMLAGGAGDVGLRRDGEVLHGNNFVVRTRGLWVQRGYAVLIPDAVDRENLRACAVRPNMRPWCWIWSASPTKRHWDPFFFWVRAKARSPP